MHTRTCNPEQLSELHWACKMLMLGALYPARVPASWNLGSTTSPQEATTEYRLQEIVGSLSGSLDSVTTSSTVLRVPGPPDGKGQQRRRKGEKTGGNINVWLPLACPPPGTWPATQACALTGNQTSVLLVRRPALSPLSHTSQREGKGRRKRGGETSMCERYIDQLPLTQPNRGRGPQPRWRTRDLGKLIYLEAMPSLFPSLGCPTSTPLPLMLSLFSTPATPELWYVKPCHFPRPHIGFTRLHLPLQCNSSPKHCLWGVPPNILDLGSVAETSCVTVPLWGPGSAYLFCPSPPHMLTELSISDAATFPDPAPPPPPPRHAASGCQRLH
nr:uncharacterized protein LOC112296351 [Desmodus rotundus]